jgi:hypothetical protein
MKRKLCFMIKDQSGVALVIALLMIVILSLIALGSVYTSIFEIKHSGNLRASTSAFYSADSAIQIVAANAENFDMPGRYIDNKYDPFVDSSNPNPTQAKVTIEYDATQEGSPEGSGFSAINFEYEHFVIESKGRDQTELGLLRSSCTIAQKVVKVTPTLQGGY